MDLRRREAPRSADGPPGAPADAQRYRCGPYAAAVWLTGTRPTSPIACVVEGPLGAGRAETRQPPSALGLQLGQVPARIGEAEVLLHRNGARLRRRDRVLTVTGPGLRWEARRPTTTTVRVVDLGAGRAVWDGTAPAAELAPDDLSPDHVAALVLFDHVGLWEGLGPNPLRFL